MPILGEGGRFELMIHGCRNWKQPADLVAVLEHLQDEAGMQALYPDYFGELPDLVTRTIPRSDFAAYCYARYPEHDDERTLTSPSSFPSNALTLWIRPPFMGEHHDVVPARDDLHVTLFAWPSEDISNTLYFSAALHDERAVLFGERLMQWYVHIAHRIIHTFAPHYVWIAEDGEYMNHIGTAELINHTFDTIYWANYYGPGFLDQPTQRLFLTAPVGRVDRVGGGVWYQLHDRFDVGAVDHVKTIEERVKTHFHQMNLDRVQWKFQML